MTTLYDARTGWDTTIKGKGGFCPCCDRWGKVYKLKLNKSLARALHWIASNGDASGWVDVQNNAPRWMLKSKTYSLLAHWGLIESRLQRSGIWRATAKGTLFVAGLDTAPAAVYVFDDKVVGVDSTQVTYTSCLGVDFNRDELLTTRYDRSDVRSAA